MGINQYVFESISFKEVVQSIKAVVKKIRTSDSETNKKIKEQASKNFCDSLLFAYARQLLFMIQFQFGLLLVRK